MPGVNEHNYTCSTCLKSMPKFVKGKSTKKCSIQTITKVLQAHPVIDVHELKNDKQNIRVHIQNLPYPQLCQNLQRLVAASETENLHHVASLAGQWLHHF